MRPLYAYLILGLQTPRLKRLAEIVSAQAIAQQEKLGMSGETYDDGQALDQVQDQGEDIAGEAAANGV